MRDNASPAAWYRRHLSCPGLQRGAQSGQRESEPAFGCLAICARNCGDLVNAKTALGPQQKRLALQDRKRLDRQEQVCAKRRIVCPKFRLVLSWTCETVRFRRLRLQLR